MATQTEKKQAEAKAVEPIEVPTRKHPTLAAALAAFQIEVPTVRKGNSAEVQGKDGKRGYSYDYADLADVTEAAMPLLGKHGLSWTTQPTLMGENFILHYSLMHESGEAIEGIYPLPDPMVGRPQDLGSAITYARRYAFTAVTGVAPGGDDDDAQAANDKPAQSKTRRASKPSAPTPQPVPEPAVATQDWAAQILDVDSIDQLRAVHGAAEKAGELGNGLSPEHGKALAAVVEHFGLPEPSDKVTVGGLIGVVKTALQNRPQPESESAPEPVHVPDEPVTDEPVTEWPTATPGGEQA